MIESLTFLGACVGLVLLVGVSLYLIFTQPLVFIGLALLWWILFGFGRY